MRTFAMFIGATCCAAFLLGPYLFALAYLVIAGSATVYGLADAVVVQRRVRQAGKERIAMMRVLTYAGGRK